MHNVAKQKRDIIVSIVIFLFFLGIIIFLPLFGISHRIYSDTNKIIIVPDPPHAFQIWTENGVRGRVLFLFDRHLNANTGDDSPASDNYVYRAIRKGLVRKIYHIIPDSAWPEVERALVDRAYFSHRGDTFSFTIDGAAIVVLRIKDIQRTREQVLMHVNGDYWQEDDIHRIIGLLRDNILGSDIITLSGTIPRTSLEEIRANEKK